MRACTSLFFPLPSSAPPSVLPMTCVVLWCQPSISDPFLRFTANFTPSSLRRLNPSIIPAFILPQFEANSTLFTGKYRWSPCIPAIFMLFCLPSLPSRSSQGFIFLHNSLETISSSFFSPASSSRCLIISLSPGRPPPSLLHLHRPSPPAQTAVVLTGRKAEG